MLVGTIVGGTSIDENRERVMVNDERGELETINSGGDEIDEIQRERRGGEGEISDDPSRGTKHTNRHTEPENRIKRRCGRSWRLI